MRCGLTFTQVSRFLHSFIYDARDDHKVDCPNCKGFLVKDKSPPAEAEGPAYLVTER